MKILKAFYSIVLLSYSVSLLAGLDFLLAPIQLVDRNPENTLATYSALHRRLGRIDDSSVVRIREESYYRIPYTNDALIALSSLIRDQDTTSETTNFADQAELQILLQLLTTALQEGVAKDSEEIVALVTELLGYVQDNVYQRWQEEIVRTLIDLQLGGDAAWRLLATVKARQGDSFENIKDVIKQSSKFETNHLISMALNFIWGKNGFAKRLEMAKKIIAYILEQGGREARLILEETAASFKDMDPTMHKWLSKQIVKAQEEHDFSRAEDERARSRSQYKKKEKEDDSEEDVVSERGDVVELIVESDEVKYARQKTAMRTYNAEGLFPIHRAAQSGKISLAQILYNKGGNLGVRDEHGLQPIHHAARNGKLEMVQWLVEQGIPVDSKDYLDREALHHACLSGNLELVIFLLEQGAHVNAEDCTHRQPLHYAAQSESDDPIMIQILVNAGARVDSAADHGIRPIHLASEQGNPRIVAELIEHDDEQARVTTRIGEEPIDIAIYHGNQAVVTVLETCVRYTRERMQELMKKAAVMNHWLLEEHLNQVYGFGCSNLYGNNLLDALVASDIRTAEAILNTMDRNLNPEQQELIRKAFIIAAAKGLDQLVHLILQQFFPHVGLELRQEALMKAAENNRAEVVKLILNRDKINTQNRLNVTPIGTRVRHLYRVCPDATLKNSYGTILKLITRYARPDLEVRDEHGLQPIHHAALKGKLEMVRWLVEQGIPIDGKDRLERQAFHYACLSGKVELVIFLIEQGADVEAKDSTQRQPMHYAALSEFDDPMLIQILVNAGARVDSAADHGIRPIHLASEQGNPRIVAELIEHDDEQARVTTRIGEEPLDIAVYFGNQAVVAVLKKELCNTRERMRELIKKAAVMNHWLLVEYLNSYAFNWSRLYGDPEHILDLTSDIETAEETISMAEEIISTMDRNLSPEQQELIRKAFIIAAARGTYQCVSSVLQKFFPHLGLELRQEALMKAAENNRDEVVKLLLNRDLISTPENRLNVTPSGTRVRHLYRVCPDATLKNSYGNMLKLLTRYVRARQAARVLISEFNQPIARQVALPPEIAQHIASFIPLFPLRQQEEAVQPIVIATPVSNRVSARRGWLESMKALFGL